MTRRGKFIFRKWARRILRIHDSPHSIATGVSIGTFFGWGPLHGAHTLGTIVTATLARCNKAAALLACWVNNPVTLLPIFYLQYHFGLLMVRAHHDNRSWEGIKNLAEAFGEISLIDFRRSMHHVGEHVKDIGWDVFWPWLLGSIVSSTLLAAVAYPLAKRAVIRHRRKVELRRAERHRRLHEHDQLATGQDLPQED
jgi:uncharacterized protein